MDCLARIGWIVIVCSSTACGTSDAEAPLPSVSTPSPGITWPTPPDDLPPEVDACVRDYREIASAGLPARPDNQAFSDWYTGPFQTWTHRYNTVRERCDVVAEENEPEDAASQVMLAAQSYMHERVGGEAEIYDEAPQMFIMSRYWTLGAACTYETCQHGADPAWTRFCRQRAEPLPPCPPVEPSTAPED